MFSKHSLATWWMAVLGLGAELKSFLAPGELEPARGMRIHTWVRVVTVPKESQPGPAEGLQPT